MPQAQVDDSSEFARSSEASPNNPLADPGFDGLNFANLNGLYAAIASENRLRDHQPSSPT
jgi:hypothetical protein